MNSIAFWRTWHPVYRRLFPAFAVFGIAAVAFLWFSNLEAPAPTFTTEAVTELEPLETPVHQFSEGTTALTVFCQTFVIFERVLGSSLHLNATASGFFLAILSIGIIVLFAVLTTLKRFWYFVGLGLLIVLLATLGLDGLVLFGVNGYAPLFAVLAVFAGLSYFLVFVRPGVSFASRLVAFGIVIAVIGVCISVGAATPRPFYYLANHSIIAGIIITLFFVFTVAHEIVAAFITAVSTATRRTKSLQHFLIITAIYLVNLALIYADKKYLIEWKFFPFSLVLLITISGILGIWGFRNREFQYAAILKADPYGSFLIITLAAIAFGTIGFLLATGNDPAFQLIQDAILYGHLGYGLIFFAYVLANFVSLLGRNLEVHKVLYEPKTMPYFTFRFAGLIATFAFFAYSNWQVSANMAYAGYYNSMGDYEFTRDTTVAETFYKRSVYYATRNYHAHYALADIYGFRDDTEKQKAEYNKLGSGRPLDIAYLNLSQLQENDHSLPLASSALMEGLKDFPGNGMLQNSLSILSDEMNRPDTALALAKAARNDRSIRKEAETNLVALSAKYQVKFQVDSLEAILNSSQPGVAANLFALATRQGIEIGAPVIADTTLTIYSAIALNNYLLNHLAKVDTSWANRAELLARKPSNAVYRDYLLAAAAQSYYSAGQTAKAVGLLREVAFATQEGVHYNTLGLWFLEQGVPINALRAFDEAMRLRIAVPLNRAVALTEMGELDSARVRWQELAKSYNPDLARHAERMSVVLSTPVQNALALSDAEKYEYSRHRFSIVEETGFNLFAGSINDTDLKAHAVLDYCTKLDEADEVDAALRVLGTLGTQQEAKPANPALVHLQLRLLARKKEWPLLAERMNAGVTFEGTYRQEQVYFEALIAEHAGKTDEALKKFSWLMSANPFFEDAIVAASAFLNKNEQIRLATYSRLVQAMDINPYSVKLHKAYVLQSAALGYMESAQSSMNVLKDLLPAPSFKKFLEENPDVFRIRGN